MSVLPCDVLPVVSVRVKGLKSPDTFSCASFDHFQWILALAECGLCLPTGQSGPVCKACKDNPNKTCRVCACHICGGKQDPDKQLMCDECDMAFHIYCLNPPLSRIPDDEDW